MAPSPPDRPPNRPTGLSDREAAIEIIRRLRDAGHEAYLAGGCVRDELLGHEPKDHDVATDARPEAIAGLFGRTAAVGASFGVMLVRDHGPTVEVATFRSDGPYTDKRRPDSVAYADARADAHRRDFTINALFIDPLEPDPARRVIDHVGGRADLEARTLRAVGDPAARLAEDHLRALRAVRFAARYALTIEPGTERAIREHAAELAGVSRERIGEEVRRMMAHATRGQSAAVLQRLGLDGPVFGAHLPEAPTRVLAALPASADVPLALAAWATDRAGTLAEPEETTRLWRRALDLSNDLSDDLKQTLRAATRFATDWDRQGVAACKRAATAPRAEPGLALLAAADPPTARRVRGEIDRLAGDRVGLAPEPLIDGDVLVACGFRPGPGFGGLLDAVYDAQLEGHLDTQDQALRLADELAARFKVQRGG